MKIQKADPAARRKSLLLVGFAGVALLVAGLSFGFDLSDRVDAIAGFVFVAPNAGVIAVLLGSGQCPIMGIRIKRPAARPATNPESAFGSQ